MVILHRRRRSVELLARLADKASEDLMKYIALAAGSPDSFLLMESRLHNILAKHHRFLLKLEEAHKDLSNEEFLSRVEQHLKDSYPRDRDLLPEFEESESSIEM